MCDKLPVDLALYPPKKLISLLIPLLLEQLLFLAVGAADTMMIASFGEDAISGVSLVDAINIIVAVFFAAMGTGGAVVTSQFLGAKKTQDANASARQLLIVALLTGLLFLPIMFFLRRPLFRLSFGEVSESITNYAMTYFKITVFTYPLMSMYMAACALFRAMNRTKISMMASFFMNVINIVGNWLLMFVFHMGVAGAAYSTLFARLVALVYLAVILANSRNDIWINYLEPVRLNLKQIRQILYIGIPSGIENVIFHIGRLLTTGFIADFGSVQIAANAVSNTLSGLGCIIGGAFSLAMITVIGQSVGTGSELTVRYYVRKMMKYVYSANVLWNLPMLACVPLLLKCFGSLTPETHNLAMVTVMTYITMQTLFWPASFVFPNALRAANDVKYVMYVSVASMLIVRVGVAMLMAKVFHIGITGVWWGMYLDWFTRIAFFTWRWKSNRWLKYVTLR